MDVLTFPASSVNCLTQLSVSRLYGADDRTAEHRPVGGERCEVLGENLPRWHFVHHKSNMTWPEIEFGRPLWISFRLPLLSTASVVWWSQFLVAGSEVPSSIPGATRFSE
jgi:hypothetical protein